MAQQSRLLKAYYMLAAAQKAANRLRERGLRVRIVPQKNKVMGPPYVEATFALIVDYSDLREMAQAQVLV